MVEYNTDVLQTKQPTAGRTTRGVHDSVGVTLGKSKAIFSLILMLVIRFRLIILDEERAKEISDSLRDLIFAYISNVFTTGITSDSVISMIEDNVATPRDPRSVFMDRILKAWTRREKSKYD